jgi:HSP20 family protein
MGKVAKISERKTPTRATETGGRTLAPWTSFEEMDRLFDRLFDRFFDRGWLRPLGLEWPTLGEPELDLHTPRVDVIERDDAFVVRAELPGVTKDDLDVSLTDRGVTLRARSHAEEKEESGDYYRREIRRGEFARTIPLPVEVDGEHTEAKFADGVLEVTLPKVEKTTRRTIEVH